MDIQTQNESSESAKYMQEFCSSITNAFSFTADTPVPGLQAVKPGLMQKDKTERLELAINDLQIGKRIQTELRQQGRSVTWLAKQLGMERTSLYYTFRQNSIDMDLLMHISAFLEHNFMQDLADVFRAYGLF